MSDIKDPYEDQLAAARYRAERDQARQECERLQRKVECLEDYIEKLKLELRDSLPREEHEAAEWVRDHGGLDEVNRKVAESMQHADEYIALRCSLAERAGDLYEMLEKEDDELIAMLDKRLMPEGMEWPRYESGETVRIGDVVSDVEVRSVVFRDGGILLSDCTSVPGWGTWRSYKEPIKRPAPKVYDADGVEIREKYDVWWICEGDERGVHAERLRVETILPDGLVECSPCNGGTWVSLEPSELYVNKPVLAADGKPLREGGPVWSVDSVTRYTVEKITDGLIPIKCRSEMGSTVSLHPSQLTHTKPEPPDSWERIEEDAEKNPCDYFGFDGEETCGKCPASGKNCEQTMARDLVRRCRALAERERGE